MTFAMIEQAVEERVRETDTLDWKASLHQEPAEFAKDVAALANLRGGHLIIGVAETKGEASKILGVEFSDSTERRLRGWVTNHVQPTLHDLNFTFLRDPKSDTTGVLIISVPASPSMPHMVTANAGQHSQTAWPRRNGTHTEWLREFDIERAYQDRFARRASDEQALATMVDLSMDLLDPGIRPWLIAVARPTTPAPATLQPPSREQISEVLAEAALNAAQIQPSGNRYSASIIDMATQLRQPPSTGLRRWVVHSHASGEPDARSDFGHIQIHHDGSILLALPCGRWAVPILKDKSVLQDWQLGAVIADLISLIDCISDLRNIETGYVVRIEPRGMLAHEPLAVASAWNYSMQTTTVSRVAHSHDVRHFTPIEIELPVLITDASKQVAAWTLVRDLVAQFGIEPETIGWPRPSDGQ